MNPDSSPLPFLWFFHNFPVVKRGHVTRKAEGAVFCLFNPKSFLSISALQRSLSSLLEMGERGRYLILLAKCFKYRSLSKILLLAPPRGNGEAVVSETLLGKKKKSTRGRNVSGFSAAMQGLSKSGLLCKATIKGSDLPAPWAQARCCHNTLLCTDSRGNP